MPLHVSFLLDGISFTLPPLHPSETGPYAASVTPFVGPDSSFAPLWCTFAALRCRDLTGSSLAISFECIFNHPCMNLPLYFKRLQFNIITRFRDCQPIMLKWLSWWLLDAVGPVLLMRSGILQKGLPAQWQSNTAMEAQYRGESPLYDYMSNIFTHCSPAIE